MGLPKQGTNHMLGMRSIAAKIFGTTNDRKVAKYRVTEEQVKRILAGKAEEAG